MKPYRLNETSYVYELTPNDSHKSFYGKARVIVDREAGTETLVSYTTEVMRRDMNTGKLTRLWHGWSATTGRHVSAFCGINKKAWDAMAVEA